MLGRLLGYWNELSLLSLFSFANNSNFFNLNLFLILKSLEKKNKTNKSSNAKSEVRNAADSSKDKSNTDKEASYQLRI